MSRHIVVIAASAFASSLVLLAIFTGNGKTSQAGGPVRHGSNPSSGSGSTGDQAAAAGSQANSASGSDPYLEWRPTKAPPFTERFVASTRRDRLVATYTWWNLLDRYGEAASLNEKGEDMGPKERYGYVREEQMKRYAEAVSKPHVKTYCEIGVNGGHGTVAMLLANPKLQVVSFDMGAFRYSEPVYDLIKKSFPGRWRIFPGNSRQTLRVYEQLVAQGAAPRCDVILVDGDHSEAGTLRDIKAMAQVAACHAVVLIDDIGSTPTEGAFGPLKALEAAAGPGASAQPWALNIDEKHVGAPPGSTANPCLRWLETLGKVPQVSENCMEQWGFAVSHYTNTAGCVGG